MATNDTPGSNPVNHDKLELGCWAEHDDGSLILVEGAENDEVVFTTFDMAMTPPVEYRAMLPRDEFENSFSYTPGDIKKSVFRFKGSKKAGKNNQDRWLWHDKTPFPWDRVMKAGFREGYKLPSRNHLLAEVAAVEASAASRVREALNLKATPLRDTDHLTDSVRDAVEGVVGIIAKAIASMKR